MAVDPLAGVVGVLLLLLLYSLMRVIYEESQHKLKPDADRMKVLVALIEARFGGASSSSDGLGVEAISRWEQRTYDLIHAAFGEELASWFKPSPTSSLADLPLDRIQDALIMQRNRLDVVLLRARDEPLRPDFDAQEYFDS